MKERRTKALQGTTVRFTTQSTEGALAVGPRGQDWRLLTNKKILHQSEQGDVNKVLCERGKSTAKSVRGSIVGVLEGKGGEGV